LFAFFPRFLSSLDDNDDNDLDGLDDEDDELDDSEDEDDEDDDGEDDLAAFFLDCCFAAFFGAFFLFFLIFVTSVLVSVLAGRPSPSTALTFRLQRPAAKSSLSCTGIFGSNAAGECVPIHWQLPTAATTKDREKIRFDFLHHVSSTRGRFGCKEERVWPCTIGLNEKGSMNDEEFDKNIDNSIVPLYPELEDTETEGKQVLLKVDSSTGRNGRDLLNKAWFRGVYLFHGLPNTTSVQQEMDMNYGPFKSVVRSNLKNIATACFSAQKSMKLGPSTFGLIVYGGVCPISKVVCENAVDRAFNVKSNLHAR
jgi:hypothetical protein